MSLPQVSVRIEISPLPSEISHEELNKAFDGELRAFNEWFKANQRARGHENPQDLLSFEVAVLKSFMFYIHTRGEKK